MLATAVNVSSRSLTAGTQKFPRFFETNDSESGLLHLEFFSSTARWLAFTTFTVGFSRFLHTSFMYRRNRIEQTSALMSRENGVNEHETHDGVPDCRLEHARDSCGAVVAETREQLRIKAVGAKGETRVFGEEALRSLDLPLLNTPLLLKKSTNE